MSFLSDGKKFATVEELFTHFDSEIKWYEKKIIFPFHRRFINPIKNFYYGLIHLPRNIKKWGKFIWYDRDWDYSFTLEAFEIKCRSQGINLSTVDISVDSKERAEQCFKCADALKRMRDQNYTSDIDGLLYDCKISLDDYIKIRDERWNKDRDIIKQSIDLIYGWWD